MSSRSRLQRSRSVGLFGGTFDPIHSGHVAVALAARKRFRLSEIHFVPAGRPPHKHENQLAPYLHRYAMVALACAGQRGFLASTMEAGADFAGRETSYSIDAVRRYRERLRRGERLSFLIGADAFLEIGTWKESEALLDLCDFIVASRPGIHLAALRSAIPTRLLGRAVSDRRAIPLRRTTVHLLDDVEVPVSSTQVRRRVARGLSIRGLVPPAVEDYIWKLALYQ